MKMEENLIHPSGFQIKKLGQFLTFRLRHYATILYQTKLLLLEQIPEGTDIIVKAYMLLWVSTVMKCQKFKNPFVTLVYHPINKKTIWKDKLSFSTIDTLVMKWYMMLGQELIGNARVYKPFWNNHCRDLSKKLWLPIETDSVGLASNLSNLSLKNQTSNSWFTIMKMLNPNQKNLLKTSCQSSTCTHVDKWEKEDTNKVINGVKKIKLNLNPRQKKIINEWFGTSRYVYNKTIHFLENKPDDFVVTKINLRNKFVTHKSRLNDPLYELYLQKSNNIKELKKKVQTPSIEQKIIQLQKEKSEINSKIKMTVNKNIKEWETNTPKEIRSYVMDDIITARKSAFSNLRNGNIKFFKMKYKKKHNVSQTITIPKSAFNFRIKRKRSKKIRIKKTKNRIGIYIKKLGVVKCKFKFPKLCGYDLKINKYNGKYYLCLPYSQKLDRIIPKYESCALDPGARTMHVLYSQHEVLKVQQNNVLMERLNKKLDIMSSLRQKSINKKNRYHSFNKRIKKINEKIKNLIDDMHYKFINYLTTKYQKIYLPSFESQDMVKKNMILHSKTKRKLNQLSHFKFKQRLQSKARTKSHCEVYIVTEDFTTKTCTNCGSLNDVKSEKKITCDCCKFKIDRDINGARNIFIKTENNLYK